MSVNCAFGNSIILFDFGLADCDPLTESYWSLYARTPFLPESMSDLGLELVIWPLKVLGETGHKFVSA